MREPVVLSVTLPDGEMNVPFAATMIAAFEPTVTVPSN